MALQNLERFRSSSRVCSESRLVISCDQADGHILSPVRLRVLPPRPKMVSLFIVACYEERRIRHTFALRLIVPESSLARVFDSFGQVHLADDGVAPIDTMPLRPVTVRTTLFA